MRVIPEWERKQTTDMHAWCEGIGVREVKRTNKCVCSLRKKPCPQNVRYSSEHGLMGHPAYRLIGDHARTWQRKDGSRFILSHTYCEAEGALAVAQEWAAENGLMVTSDPRDAWYGFGTMPLRFDVARPTIACPTIALPPKAR